MIFVIGDIHGMVKPLERILSKIREYHETVEQVKKIIFIGDYCDHGMYTKEVIDTLLDLEFPKIFLAGNHDDSLIRFLCKVNITKKRSFRIYLNQEGISNTFMSLLKETDRFENFYRLQDEYHNCKEEEFDVLYPEQKYMDFFINLKYSHKETLNCGYGNVNFRFFHGLPRIDQTLDEQSPLTFDDFESYMRKEFKQFDDILISWEKQYRKSFSKFSFPISDIFSPEFTFIWHRIYNFKYAYEGDVIIHGHTPTIVFNKIFVNHGSLVPPFYQSLFNKYKNESRLPFLFSRDQNAGYSEIPEINGKNENCVFSCGKHSSIEAINVDTGSVYRGGALTALGLSEKNMANNELVVLTALTLPSDEPQRESSILDEKKLLSSIPENPEVILRTIKIGRLGADISDPKRNPTFPFEKFRTTNDVFKIDK
ncbi:MAG: metallophosphoesterase [Rickettsiales bacterium]|jgi:predicted phosphodiesterase|nr:metallophosphoesterase [Rickettsiales bacterium]